jgi:hypothetical protein
MLNDVGNALQPKSFSLNNGQASGVLHNGLPPGFPNGHDNPGPILFPMFQEPIREWSPNDPGYIQEAEGSIEVPAEDKLLEAEE